MTGWFLLLGRRRQEDTVFLLTILLFLTFSFVLHGFLTTGNIIALLRSVALLGILAVGMGIVVIGRGIDLSLVAILAISVAVFLNLLGQSYPIGIALLLALVGVIAVGALNGILTAYAEMPAIFATLATGTFVYGLGRSQFLTQDVIYLPPGHDLFTAFGNARLASIPVEVVVFAFILVGAFLWLRFSKYGRYIYLIGDNLNAARNAGLPVRPVIVLQYVVSALLAFVAGLIMAAGIHSMNTRIVNSSLLYDVILVVVIGGIGLSGGKGGVRNLIVGTLLIGILLNGMTILDISDLYQNLIKATVLLAALIVDGVLNPRDEQTDQQGDI
jgi:ribose transport system permease protein